MIKVEHIETCGWGPALRGMRNALNSWDRADSTYARVEWLGWDTPCIYQLGPNDTDLAKRLISAGSPDHRKFLRMLVIFADVTAPLYWWKEADTYKVGTVANSCSTMHTVMADEFTRDMFSWERDDDDDVWEEMVLNDLNAIRRSYLEAKERHADGIAERYWNELIQKLPSSWNQKRTFMFNYEVMSNIYKSRKHHKLQEWHDFIDAITENVPYPWLFGADEK